MAALVDYFLHIEGVDGESPDQQYNGWIKYRLGNGRRRMRGAGG